MFLWVTYVNHSVVAFKASTSFSSMLPTTLEILILDWKMSISTSRARGASVSTSRALSDKEFPPLHSFVHAHSRWRQENCRVKKMPLAPSTASSGNNSNAETLNMVRCFQITIPNL